MVIEDIGKALWGDRWQSKMARALNISRDAVQDWSKKNYEFRPDVAEKLRALLRERRKELEEIEESFFGEKESRMSCPECDGRIRQHMPTFDGGLYECRKHGLFGVSGSAEACGFWKQDKRTRTDAFRSAKARGEKHPRARNDPRPLVLITTYDY